MRAEDRRNGRRTWRERLIGLGGGVFFAFDLLLWQHSVQQVGAGLATVLANLSVIVVGLIGWLVLRERPTARMFAGLVLVLGGAVLISGVFDRAAYGANPVLGVAFGLSAAVAYAGYLLLARRGNVAGRHAFGTLFDASAASTAVAAVVGLGSATLISCRACRPISGSWASRSPHRSSATDWSMCPCRGFRQC